MILPRGLACPHQKPLFVYSPHPPTKGRLYSEGQRKVEYYLLSHIHIRLLLLIFSEFVSHSTDTSLWNLVDVSNNSQLGSDERVVRKVEKIKRLAREAAIPENAETDEVSAEDREEVQRLKEALQETRVASLREKEQAEVHVSTIFSMYTVYFHITYTIKRYIQSMHCKETFQDDHFLLN